MNPDNYYQPLDDHTWQPTRHVQGAWNPKEQHMAPVAGLLTHALENHDPRPELITSRLTFEILGMMPLEETRIECRTVRPGRTIEMVEAYMTTVSAPDRPVVRATAWRLSASDTSEVAGNAPAAMPGPEQLTGPNTLASWPGGFIESVQAQIAERGTIDSSASSAPEFPKTRLAWLSSTVALLPRAEDGTLTEGPLAHFVRLVDSANGVATNTDPRVWMFPNTDLSIHLWRAPSGDFTGLETTATLGNSGVGLTHTVLHDEHGPVGRAAQILTVRRMPKP